MCTKTLFVIKGTLSFTGNSLISQSSCRDVANLHLKHETLQVKRPACGVEMPLSINLQVSVTKQSVPVRRFQSF